MSYNNSTWRLRAENYFDEWKNSSTNIKNILDSIKHNHNVDAMVNELMMQCFITGIEFGVLLVDEKLKESDK